MKSESRLFIILLVAGIMYYSVYGAWAFYMGGRIGMLVVLISVLLGAVIGVYLIQRDEVKKR